MNLCKRGHDKDKVGTNGVGRCCECRREYDAGRRDYVDGPTLPYEDYAAFIKIRGINAYDAGSSGSMVKRWRERGVPFATADTLAVKLGVHPSAIWGDAWFAE
jgi:hypothetical protein